MARKKKSDDATPTPEAKKTKDLLVRLRTRFQLMEDADHDNRTLAMADIKFVNLPGWQWDDNMKKERGNRPCYEFNKIRVSGKRVINEIRANRPQGKIRAVEDGDVDKAEMLEGLCRNIWNTSDGDTIVDYAAEYQVNGGMGAWRVVTEYSSDEAFDQDICIEPIKNPFCLYVDPSAKDFMKRDAEDWILTDRVSKAAYEARWPNKKVSDFDEAEFDSQLDWQDEDSVRIVEYWYKEPYDRTIYLLADGRTVDELQPGDQAVKERKVKSSKIMMCIASGEAILEGPTEFAGPDFPFIMVFGEHVVIDGKVYWWGLPRFGKDAQKSYNVAATATIEKIANAPKEYEWVTPAQIEGLGERIMEAHQKNFPVRIYNPDPHAPGPPQRISGADVPSALIQQMQMASQDIRETLGIHEASFGQESNEKSGVALRAKQSQAEIVTYNFPDNMAKGIQRTWEIMVNLIPKVYDSQRSMRILGTDGEEDYVTLNERAVDPKTGQATVINDLSMGKYDATVTVGPGYATKRLEAADTYMQLAQGNPEIMPIAGDLIFKSLDVPYADDIAERLRTMLPPPIQQLLNKDKNVTPEMQAVMAQADQAMQQVQEQGKLVQAAAQELEQVKADADKAKADAQIAQANLKTAQAQFDAHIAQTKADLQSQSLDLQLQQHGNEQQGAQQDLAQAVSDIKQWAAEFAQTNTQILQEIMGKQQTQVIVPPAHPRPKIVSIKAKRVNGELQAIPQYEDDMQQMMQQPGMTPGM